VLSRLSDDTTGDSTFINASYIDGLEPKAYIATAMPHNVTTRKDFWRMAYEQKSKIIMSLNDECEQHNEAYWPKLNAPPVDYGLFMLTTISDKKLYGSSDSIKRSFLIKWADGKEHTIYQYQYKEWPDMGIPQEKDEFIHWLDDADSLYEDTKINMGPVIVHCFGGVGRTGTFLTIHSALQKMKRRGGNAMQIEQLLSLMRHERANLVQTAEQYKFCYRILLEFYEGKRALVAALACLKPKD